jgi:hypothetical protein
MNRERAETIVLNAIRRHQGEKIESLLIERFRRLAKQPQENCLVEAFKLGKGELGAALLKETKIGSIQYRLALEAQAVDLIDFCVKSAKIPLDLYTSPLVSDAWKLLFKYGENVDWSRLLESIIFSNDAEFLKMFLECPERRLHTADISHAIVESGQQECLEVLLKFHGHSNVRVRDASSILEFDQGKMSFHSDTLTWLPRGVDSSYYTDIGFIPGTEKYPHLKSPPNSRSVYVDPICRKCIRVPDIRGGHLFILSTTRSKCRECSREEFFVTNIIYNPNKI